MKKKKTPPIVKLIKEHKLPEIDYSWQKTISFSQLSTFLNCSHKWALMYKDGHYKPEQNINLTFGTAIHNVVQNYFNTFYNESITKADEINLVENFEEQFRNIYMENYVKNESKHFSNSVEMAEFFQDGTNILEQLKKKKTSYFSKKGWWLVGCEIPIIQSPYPRFKNVIFKGFIDMVLYHEKTKKFTIYDFKTATYSWGDRHKKDEIKIMQLLLYKYFFSKQFNIPIEDIEVEFFILKRKLPEDNPYFLKHFQQFRPAAGKNKVTKAVTAMENFIKMCFDENGMKQQNYPPTPTEYGCKYCVFRERKDLCSMSI